MSRKTNNLKKRIAILEQQSVGKRMAKAIEKERAASLAAYSVHLQREEYEKRVAGTITVEKTNSVNYPVDMYQISVTFSMFEMRRAFLTKSGQDFASIDQFATEKAHQVAQKLRDILIETPTGRPT